jgi:hypothetical protein
MSDNYVLDIAWDKPGLPDLVGPFENIIEAKRWAKLNVPNGTSKVRTLAYPYMRPVVAIEL